MKMMTDINYCWLSLTHSLLSVYTTVRRWRKKVLIYIDHINIFPHLIIMQIFSYFLFSYKISVNKCTISYKCNFMCTNERKRARKNYFHGTTQKKLQACKNLSKNWHFIIIHLFFDFFQFLYFFFLLQLLYGSFLLFIHSH